MNEPLVSIIIPLYNAQNYIAETITSVIDQTWPNKEIIIVDDGSTDNSLAVAKSFECDWIKVFTQKSSSASAARNRGLAECTGDYIQFLDADDLLSADKISLQLNRVIDKPDMLAICPMVDFHQSADILSVQLKKHIVTTKPTTDTLQFLLHLYNLEDNDVPIVPVHAWLTPKWIIKKAGLWNENLTVNDDGEFFCRVVLASNGIVPVNEATCYYRRYKGTGRSLSGRKDILSLQSQYQSLLLINEHLKKAGNDVNTINTITAQNMALLLMQAYPEHKKLAKKISQNIRELGGTTHIPVLGGKMIEIIKKIFGWKTARILQFCLHKIVKS